MLYQVLEEYKRKIKLLKDLNLGEETKYKQIELREDNCKTFHCHIQNKIRVTSLLHVNIIQKDKIS